MDPAVILLILYAILLTIFSPWSFIAMWRDKRAAEAGEWRTPEIKLHALELFGGWPGSLLAQLCFRHKIKKPSYQTVFWIITGGHIIGLIVILVQLGFGF